MASRDYESSPASETLGLDDIIKGLAKDLDELRAGKITTQDAIARSMLAKQIFNGVRLYLTGTKILSARATSTAAIAERIAKDQGERDG